MGIQWWLVTSKLFQFFYEEGLNRYMRRLRNLVAQLLRPSDVREKDEALSPHFVAAGLRRAIMEQCGDHFGVKEGLTLLRPEQATRFIQRAASEIWAGARCLPLPSSFS